MLLFAMPVQAKKLQLKIKSIQVETKGARPSKQGVKRVVSRNVQRLRSCLKGAVKNKNHYKGWLWLNFKFRRSGKVREAAANSTISNKFTMKCIKMRMNRWKVGRGKGGKVTTTVKIVY